MLNGMLSIMRYHMLEVVLATVNIDLNFRVLHEVLEQLLHRVVLWHAKVQVTQVCLLRPLHERVQHAEEGVEFFYL